MNNILYYYNNTITEQIEQDTGLHPIKKGNKFLFPKCPVCGHFGHFFTYPDTDSYYSFSACCRGGDLVTWLVEYHKIPMKEALQRVKGELQESPDDKAKRQEAQKLAKLLTQKVEAFFNVCVQKYQLFRYADNEFKVAGVDYIDPFYRYIRQGLLYYDRITEEFINADFERRVRMMNDFNNEYFHKLGVTS